LTQPLRIGIIGCGRVVELGYIPALKKARGAQLVAVADPDLERCNRIAPGIRACRSARELIDTGGLDAIVIATPAAAHLHDAQLAGAAGLPTLVEKPPAANVAEAVALAQVAPLPRIGFNRRFDPRVQDIRAKIPNGSAVEVTLERFQTGSWNPYVVRDDLLASHGPHYFDLMRWLTRSEIIRVRTLELTAQSVSIEVELERGRALARFGLATGFHDSIEVRDAAGTLIAGHETPGFFQRAASRFLSGASSLAQLLIGELEEFTDAANGRPVRSLATAFDGVPVMAAIEAARESAVSGDWATIARYNSMETA
jgi:predicted dehydrogenase